jgi:hypothetical protein
MNLDHAQLRAESEEFLAQLTDTAYQFILRQGLKRPFLEVEIEIWQQLRAVFEGDLVTRVSSEPVVDLIDAGADLETRSGVGHEEPLMVVA